MIRGTGCSVSTGGGVIGGPVGGVADPSARLFTIDPGATSAPTVTVYVSVTDSPTASEPLHVRVEPSTTGAEPSDAVGAPVSSALSSTRDRSSVITTGSSTVAPVFVPVTV